MLIDVNGTRLWFDVDGPGLVPDGSSRRVAGDSVAEIARRDYAGDPVPAQDWARVFAAFGPRVPDGRLLAGIPKNEALNPYGMELIRRLDIIDQLSRVETPTLVSVGDLDPITPVGAAEEIVGALPDGVGRLVVLAGAGHFPWLDDPDRYWPTVIEFVACDAADGGGR